MYIDCATLHFIFNALLLLQLDVRANLRLHAPVLLRCVRCHVLPTGACVYVLCNFRASLCVDCDLARTHTHLSPAAVARTVGWLHVFLAGGDGARLSRRCELLGYVHLFWPLLDGAWCFMSLHLQLCFQLPAWRGASAPYKHRSCINNETHKLKPCSSTLHQ